MLIFAEPFSRSWAECACAFISTQREPAHTALRYSRVSSGGMATASDDGDHPTAVVAQTIVDQQADAAVVNAIADLLSRTVA